MYEKLKQINSNLWNNRIIAFKLFFIIVVILFALLILFITVLSGWSELLVYPEEVYETLESEARTMADTHNLETDYVCTYTYDNSTNSLSLDLSNSSPFAEITATISNYRTDIQDISITRDFKNAVLFVLFNLSCIVIFIPWVLALIIEIPFIVIFKMIFLIASLFHTIRKK